MTKEEFKVLLTSKGIDCNMVSFNDNLHEGYCIRKNHFRWETLVRERGKEYDILGFPSEGDALKSMCEELIRLYARK